MYLVVQRSSVLSVSKGLKVKRFEGIWRFKSPAFLVYLEV